LIGSPVAGFRPSRALRRCTTSLQDAGNDELTRALQLFLRQPEQFFEQVTHRGALHVELVRKVREQFHLAHATGVSHVCSPEVERANHNLSSLPARAWPDGNLT
jgi:hypothetical protein